MPLIYECVLPQLIGNRIENKGWKKWPTTWIQFLFLYDSRLVIVGYLYHRTRQIRETIIVFRCFSFDFRRKGRDAVLECWDTVLSKQEKELLAPHSIEHTGANVVEGRRLSIRFFAFVFVQISRKTWKVQFFDNNKSYNPYSQAHVHLSFADR